MTIDLKFSINATDAARANREINTLISEIEDKKSLLRLIGEALLKTTQDRFHKEEDPDGAKWKALSPLTLALKKGGSILRQSGGLMGSLHFNVSGNTLTVAPNKKYAHIHQVGGTITAKGAKALAIPFKAGFKGKDGKRANKGGLIFLNRVTIPARPYLGFGRNDEQAVSDAVEKWKNGI